MKLFKLTPVILLVGFVMGLLSTIVFLNISWFLGLGGYLITLSTGFLLFVNQKNNKL